MLSGSGEHYALEVKGDSMIDAGIHEGDVVVVRRQSTANNGDIVATEANAVIGELDATAHAEIRVIRQACRTDSLSVYARYTRRGGIDINPFRSDCESSPGNTRLWRQ